MRTRHSLRAALGAIAIYMIGLAAAAPTGGRAQEPDSPWDYPTLTARKAFPEIRRRVLRKRR